MCHKAASFRTGDIKPDSVRPFSAPGRGFGFTVSLPNTATCYFSFSFSDEHLFPA
ncbi:hypothetical protein CFSAN001690_21240 [Salmonella enterica subsp. enterica serovar Cerro str. CFSAN001690]|nr:hypothetical protein CFSAN001691_22585 [Salmonella enterica subsp. enterica serovar Cerro str. CFSAN001691]ETB75956.1 hypothetical protein CFSAN001680_21595 [Salmonella enterica subsp. enterica serovar Cerro str. CFSAN001680]ETB84830.1 hypothetical protein CFSAN001690_21240 [Salmonella enterica subsp. enterica serovar Cerro str. CFSAN001690]ETB88448.1 hypothetical protein CFSAN001674_22660 [Salmonella enterica subsp. enterica serovar Cerro str. CFSAN001674]ETB97047.1 hypothetical protein CFS